MADKLNILGAGGMVEIDREETLVPHMLIWSRASSPLLWAVKREMKKNINTVLLNISTFFFPLWIFSSLRLGSLVLHL